MRRAAAALLTVLVCAQAWAGNLVGDMTANNAPSPLVASAQGEYSSAFAAWKAFDRDPASFWFSTSGMPKWLAINLGSAAAAHTYTVEVDEQSVFTYAPTAWTFQGSSNGSAWTTLDTQTGLTWTDRTNARVFNFSNSTAYQYYRINVSTAGTYAGIHELAIYDAMSTQYGFVWDGDSLGTSYGRINTRNTFLTLADCEHWMTAARYNVAIAGKRIDEQTAVAATNVDPLLSSLSGYTRKLVVFQCGANDLMAGASAATVASRLATYVADRISAGFDAVVVMTVTKASTISGGNDTSRQTYNANLLSSPPSGAIVVDLASLSEFSNTANTTYYLDGVHFTLVGQKVVADAIFARLPLGTVVPKAMHLRRLANQ